MKKRMRTEQKSNVKNSIRRLAFVAISVLIQLVWILEQFIRLNRYSTAISLISSLLALLLVLRIYGKQQNSAFKMSWTAPGSGGDAPPGADGFCRGKPVPLYIQLRKISCV